MTREIAIEFARKASGPKPFPDPCHAAPAGALPSGPEARRMVHIRPAAARASEIAQAALFLPPTSPPTSTARRHRGRGITPRT